jgi:hypothetical protein
MTDGPILLWDEAEAGLLHAVLEEKNIPHFIKQYMDPPFRGVHTYRDSWGHVDAPAGFRGKVTEILGELRHSRKQRRESGP